jgi:hypothetical protein
MIQPFVDWSIPEIPDPIPMIQIPTFYLRADADLFSNLGSPILSN